MRAADGERHCLLCLMLAVPDCLFYAILPTALLRVSSSHQPPLGSHWVTPATDTPLLHFVTTKRLALLLPAASSLHPLSSSSFPPFHHLSAKTQTCTAFLKTTTGSRADIVQTIT